MRCIGDELTLCAKRVADTAEQSVHDVREAPQFIVRGDDLQALVEVGCRNGGRARRDVFQRGKAPACQRVAGKNRGQ